MPLSIDVDDVIIMKYNDKSYLIYSRQYNEKLGSVINLHEIGEKDKDKQKSHLRLKQIIQGIQDKTMLLIKPRIDNIYPNWYNEE